MIEKKPIDAKVFLDSNIIIYLYSAQETNKTIIVESLINNFSRRIVSTQVLNEFINVMYKKRSINIESLTLGIKEILGVFALVHITTDTIYLALHIANKCKYTYFDSLIIASALENGCDILFTEDMHHNHIIEDKLAIINPFK